MKEVTVPLEPTISYQHRLAVWHRYTKAGYLVWGVLSILEAKRAGLRQKTSRYVVQELQPVRDGRRFRLHPALYQDSEVSFVLLHNTWNRSECTCKGWTGHGYCKHTGALAALGVKNLPPAKRQGYGISFGLQAPSNDGVGGVVGPAIPKLRKPRHKKPADPRRGR